MPNPDYLDILIEESMPWLMAWCFVLALVIGAIVVGNAKVWMEGRRSPLEKLVRGRRAGV